MIELLAKLLGATGVAFGIFYLLYTQLIEKVKLAALTKKQSFTLLLVIVGAIWTFVVIVILVDGGVQFGGGNSNDIGGNADGATINQTIGASKPRILGQQSSSGDCSPNILTENGNVSLSC